jgi:hypothetical protein
MKKQCRIGRKFTIDGVTFPKRCLLAVHGEDVAHYDGDEWFITFEKVNPDSESSVVVYE